MLCLLYVMPLMVGILFTRSDSPFRMTRGCELYLCLFEVKRVMEDFCGDLVILFWVSHCIV